MSRIAQSVELILQRIDRIFALAAWAARRVRSAIAEFFSVAAFSNAVDTRWARVSTPRQR